MRHQTTGLVLAALGVLALAGCGEKTETKTTTTTTTTAAADGAVVRKAGLWEQTTHAEGMGPATIKICLSSNVAPCGDVKVTRTADGYTMAGTCKTPNGTFAVEAAAKGDLATAYTLTSKTVVTGAPVASMNGTVNDNVSLRYLGPCAEGMTAGQIQSDEGAVVDYSNFDPAKARELAKQAGK